MRPSSVLGWLTVVGGSRLSRPKSMSSYPITETWSDTRTPRRVRPATTSSASRFVAAGDGRGLGMLGKQPLARLESFVSRAERTDLDDRTRALRRAVAFQGAPDAGETVAVLDYGERRGDEDDPARSRSVQPGGRRRNRA